MRVLIDGVFFQLAQSGIARVWKSILPYLSNDKEIDLFMLDRGGYINDQIGLKILPFPSYNENYAADDSILVQNICDFYKVDVFMSTFFTTPLGTPALQLVYDMIPEIFDFDLSHPFWAEKETAINYALRFICISQSTKNDLLKHYPEIDSKFVTVAHLGYNKNLFVPRSADEINSFRKAIGTDRPYLLMVGSRSQNKGYKNGQILFDALAYSKEDNFDVVCIGGEPEIPLEVINGIPSKVRVFRVEADDAELARAYSGAAAFVYPSLYEGFGLPVVEALGCECPIITTDRASLAEIARNEACLIIDPNSAKEVSDALQAIKSVDTQLKMKHAARKEREKYDWINIANEVKSQLRLVMSDQKDESRNEFYKKWQYMRYLESEINTNIV